MNSTKKNIVFIFRHKDNSKFSVESIFCTLQPKVADGIGINCRNIHLPYHSRGFINKVKNWLYFFRLNNNDIYHITGEIYYIAFLQFNKKYIITIHDVRDIFESNNLFKRIIIYFVWYFFPFLLAYKITAISQTTASVLKDYFPFVSKKIRVIPNFTPMYFSSNPQKDINNHYQSVLFIGTKDNKNLLRTIEALSNLNLTLKIVGKLNDEQLFCLNKNRIEYINYRNVTQAELLNIYRSSSILLFPSTYEGFGLPILEAQSQGLPVVTSNCSSMPEVAGNGAHFIDPYDIQSIRFGVLKVMQDQHYRQDLIQKGVENCMRFDLETIAQEYIDLYNEVCAL